MSETDEGDAPTWQKGDRAAIVSGKKNLGVRGEIFWIGENKYGPGMRYGLKGDDGETYWADESHLGSEKDAPPAPEPPDRGDVPVLAKGQRVEITGGREGVGEQGEIFWVGESKFGRGMRYGIRASEDDTFWVDDEHVVALDAAPGAGDGGANGGATEGAPPPLEEAPLPDPDEFADDLDGPPPDDAPFPPDDMPF